MKKHKTDDRPLPWTPNKARELCFVLNLHNRETSVMGHGVITLPAYYLLVVIQGVNENVS